MALAQTQSPVQTQIVRRSRRIRRETLVAYAFLAPSLLLLLIFRHGPAVFSLFLSLFDWTMVDDP